MKCTCKKEVQGKCKSVCKEILVVWEECTGRCNLTNGKRAGKSEPYQSRGQPKRGLELCISHGPRAVGGVHWLAERIASFWVQFPKRMVVSLECYIVFGISTFLSVSNQYWTLCIFQRDLREMATATYLGSLVVYPSAPLGPKGPTL